MSKAIASNRTPGNLVGIGFKPMYLDNLLDARCSVSWLEIHAENYMVDGGPKLAMLEMLRERYPISCHGVGLSIGADQPLDQDHIARLRSIQEWLKPALFSEHLAWSSHGSNFYNDLLPIPYTDKTLNRVVQHLNELQQALGRQILLENPSSYLSFKDSHWHEAEFIAEVIHRSGCGLLLDINNVIVSANNLAFDCRDYMSRLPLDAVGEIHLAGHSLSLEEHDTLLIDSHDQTISDDVWLLFSDVLQQIDPCPVLVERDGNLPPFSELHSEVERAVSLIASVAVAA